YDAEPLDDLLRRTEAALQADTREEMDRALGGHGNYSKRFRDLVEKESPAKRPSGSAPGLRDKVYLAITDGLDEHFNQEPFKPEVVKADLRNIHRLGLEWRANVGGVRPSPGLPLSTFSGRPGSEAVPLDKDGRVQERLPANNVAALGRSLFS